MALGSNLATNLYHTPFCPFTSYSTHTYTNTLNNTQVSAQSEVVGRAMHERLAALVEGDYEEPDEELDRMAAEFQQVCSSSFLFVIAVIFLLIVAV